jgi:hypothetical protein
LGIICYDTKNNVVVLSLQILELRYVIASNFIFQQDDAPAHTARTTQQWIEQNSPDFMKKDVWSPNSPDLYPLDYHVWGNARKVPCVYAYAR